MMTVPRRYFVCNCVCYWLPSLFKIRCHGLLCVPTFILPFFTIDTEFALFFSGADNSV